MTLLGPALACDVETTSVAVEVVFPEDASALQSADNVTVRLQPGIEETFTVDGPEETFELELSQDDVSRQLELYYARGTTLLGYGRTPPFTYLGAQSVALRLLVAYPGALTPFPGTFDLVDANTIAAGVDGLGMVAVTGDGTTIFVDGHSLELKNAMPWPTDRPRPEPGTGAFVSAGVGSVAWLRWTTELEVVRFDAIENTWTIVPCMGDAADGRTGAAFLQDPNGGSLLLFGGGERSDVARVDLSDPAEVRSSIEATLELDDPRAGAEAIASAAGEILLVGGSNATRPRVWALRRREGAGPTGDWTGLRCQLIPGGGSERESVVCAGGSRAGMPTADALLLGIPATGPIEVDEQMGWLSAPAADVRWFADELAVYAQAASMWDRFALPDLGRDALASPATLVTGGQRIVFPTGVTFVVGGADETGRAENRWYVFAPALMAL